MLDLNSEMASGYLKHGIFVICRNKLNGFRDLFYHGTNVGAGSCPRQDINMIAILVGRGRGRFRVGGGKQQQQACRKR
jgi:hypothetical protein